MIDLDETHAPSASSWVDGADAHREFPVQNLPLGIFSTAERTKRGGVAIGDFVCDLGAVEPLLSGDAAQAASLASGETLNALFADGNALADALRKGLFELLDR